jgi:hypothetical protein
MFICKYFRKFTLYINVRYSDKKKKKCLTDSFLRLSNYDYVFSIRRSYTKSIKEKKDIQNT